MHSLLTEFLFSKMYLVTLSSILGDAGDSLVYHNGMEFSTNDKDHDEYKDINCAKYFQSAWWYKSCYWSSLNGRYSQTSQLVAHGHSVQWGKWKGIHYSLKKSEMKTRPRAS